MSLLHTKIADIEDPDLLSLLEELRDATMASPEPGILVLHYLQACHHPFGASDKWKRIEKARLAPGRLLTRKIGKLSASAVKDLCREIGRLGGLGSMEGVEGMALYEFFNKYTPHPLKKQPKRPHDPRDTLRRMGF